VHWKARFSQTPLKYNDARGCDGNVIAGIPLIHPPRRIIKRSHADYVVGGLQRSHRYRYYPVYAITEDLPLPAIARGGSAI